MVNCLRLDSSVERLGTNNSGYFCFCYMYIKSRNSKFLENSFGFN